MNVRIKTSIIIIITLLIGVVAGVLINRTVMQNQFQQRVASLRHPYGMIRMFERIIDPGGSQYEVVREVLEKRSNQLHKIGEESRKEMKAVLDSLKTELDPLLTYRQKERLRMRIERLKNWSDKGPPFRPKRGRLHNRPMEPPPHPPLNEEESLH